MAIIRLDSNSNNSKWKMFFDKINDGSPFGVIKIDIFINILTYSINKSSYIIEGIFIWEWF